MAPHKDRRDQLQSNHTTLKYKLWDLSEANAMVRECYPQFVNLWETFPHGINKADFFRYVLMHKFGGCYFDVDFVSCRSIEPLLMKDVCVVGEEWPHSFRDATVHNGALICGSVEHPFWMHVMNEVLRRSHRMKNCNDIQESVFKLTGTAMLRDTVMLYWNSQNHTHHLFVAPFFTFCPVVAYGNILSSYDNIPSRGSWRYPESIRMEHSHVFSFIAPSYITWQKTFKKNQISHVA